MHVTFSKGFFICHCRFEERHQPKSAKFQWDDKHKVWFTKQIKAATRLREFCDSLALKQIDKVLLKNDLSHPPLSYNKEQTPFPFQLEGAKFALSRNRSYLYFDPGLGKTIVASIIIDTLKLPTLYLCPPFLMLNTKEEILKWRSSLEIEPKHTRENHRKANVLIAPDSMIAKKEWRENMLSYFEDIKGDKLLVVDEAHRFKNPYSQRTETLFKEIFPKFERVLFLSGTMMPNRPIELFPVLSNAAPETIDFMNYFEFGKHYCSAFKDQFGWNFSGASHMEELSERIKPFVLRCTKAILKDLPPKTEEMVLIGGDVPKKLKKMDRRILELYSPKDLMKASIALKAGKDEELHIATYRRLLGEEKVKESVKYIKGILEDTEEPLIIFAIHKATITALTLALESYNPLVVTGETRTEARHEIVKTFQREVDRRVFIGNIQAAGIGITLTKASRVIMVEFDWVPGNNSQASDRAHRIGQKNHVLVEYLVYKNSVDSAVLKEVLRKSRNIAKL